jgi:translation elongation factor EF-1beta
MSQTFFVWTHGGNTVKLAGTFNNWIPQPLTKQGNYFFELLNLPDGLYQYKYVVDGRWVYDLSQVHVDDGSGNWNNQVEVGAKSAVVIPSHQPVKQHQQQQQPAKEPKPQQQQQKQQQKPQQDLQQKSKKQLRKEQQQQKQQQQAKPEAKPEPEPEPVAQPEPAPAQTEAEDLPEAEAVPETEAEPASQPEIEPEDGEVPAAAEVQTPQAPEKVLISLITLEIVAQIDTNMEEFEKFVRSLQRPGLKWEGSAVKDHVFGLQKLEIICQARDDVAIEGEGGVLEELMKNEELVAGASILGFAC